MWDKGHSRDGPGPATPHCAVVCRALEPGRAGGLASAAATMLATIIF
jgi:hypothetical protein